MTATTDRCGTTLGDLYDMLPLDVALRLDRDFAQQRQIAAALRLLTTISPDEWAEHAHESHVDWGPLIDRARQRPGGPANSVRVRLEIAASMAGYAGAHVALLYTAFVLEHYDRLALLDALSILMEGVNP